MLQIRTNDINNETSNYIYLSNILNDGTVQYLESSDSVLECILPVSCYFRASKCKEHSNCFQQKICKIRHSGTKMKNREYDTPKVFYKVFVPKEFASEILENIPISDYYKVAQYGPDKTKGSYCTNSGYSYND